MLLRWAVLAASLLILACAGLRGTDEPAPLGQLPRDVRPLHYDLALEVVPERERFSGKVAIDRDLKRPRRQL